MRKGIWICVSNNSWQHTKYVGTGIFKKEPVVVGLLYLLDNFSNVVIGAIVRIDYHPDSHVVVGCNYLVDGKKHYVTVGCDYYLDNNGTNVTVGCDYYLDNNGANVVVGCDYKLSGSKVTVGCDYYLDINGVNILVPISYYLDNTGMTVIVGTAGYEIV